MWNGVESDMIDLKLLTCQLSFTQLLKDDKIYRN